ncbi:hypothetical protein B5X24_HaOG216785 [Helicoverpa armigera]|nr:hypothetical protein B5X24_HaOG216785 [Helicoverpa armigera]
MSITSKCRLRREAVNTKQKKVVENWQRIGTKRGIGAAHAHVREISGEACRASSGGEIVGRLCRASAPAECAATARRTVRAGFVCAPIVNTSVTLSTNRLLPL